MIKKSINRNESKMIKKSLNNKRFLSVVLLPSILSLFLMSRLFAAESSSTKDDRKDVAITVYNSNIALVKETREIQIGKGIFELKFMDVAAQINPKTTHLKSLTQPDQLEILEQNYEYDLINPDKLMEKYVGQEVELIEQNENFVEKTTKATLLSVNQGPIYKIGDRISIGHAGRVVLPKIPENLVSTPTLVWLLNNRGETRHRVEASYLTSGLNWLCDYVVSVNEDDTKADLTGWVTIDNRSGATYENALLKLVAGEIHRVEEERAYLRKGVPMEAAAAPQFVEEAFFEYHLYSLDRRTTIKDNQTKQMNLLTSSDIPVLKRLLIAGRPYYYRNRYGTIEQNQKVGVFLEIKNTKENHLGVPLPKGTVRVYKKDKSGALQFIGEDSIDHTPKDEMVKLKIGEAFDVVCDRIQTDFKNIKIFRYDIESAYEIKIRNHKSEAVSVTVREPIPGSWEIVEASHEWEKIDAHTIEFNVSIPKDGEVSIKYRVRVGW
ncbi:MAG: DUF4139 domain-containing protein [Acidobacteriota bacterium]